VYECPEYKIQHHDKKHHHQGPAYLNKVPGRRGPRTLSVGKMEFLSHLIKNGVEESGLFESVRVRGSRAGLKPEKEASYSSIESSTDWMSTTTEGYPSSTLGDKNTVSRDLTQNSIGSTESGLQFKDLFHFQQNIGERPLPTGEGGSNCSELEVDLRDSVSDSLELSSCESQIPQRERTPPEPGKWYLDYAFCKGSSFQGEFDSQMKT